MAAGPSSGCRRSHLDRASADVARCTACHATGGGFAHQGHPSDVVYSTHGKELRAEPTSFNSAVVLSRNKITCLTCHDPRSRLPHHLAAPTGGEVEKRLCVACHPH